MTVRVHPSIRTTARVRVPGRRPGPGAGPPAGAGVVRSFLVLLLAALVVLSGCGGRGGRPRVLVIGLDGGSFGVIDPLLAEGVLPNLAALMGRGSSATLETIFPVVSPPAWTSATTGVNPGRHNIFDFFHLSRTGPNALLTSSLDRRAHPVWRVLNEEGYRTGILNIPMTFPPDKVDGFFVAGFPYGQATSGFTYPPALEEELNRDARALGLPGFPLDPFGESIRPGREGALLAHFKATLEAHQTSAKRLMTEEKWDLFWVVFTGTDKVQHFFWKFADENHPEYNRTKGALFGKAIREFWIRIDEIVGEMVALAGPDTDVIVMSDHGFGPIYRELRMSRWLQSEGFVEDGDSGPRWEAFSPGPFGGLVRVNQKGRDYQGRIAPGAASDSVVSGVRHKLESLVDPATGARIVEKVFARDEIYSGPYVENAPDLLFLEAPTYFVGRGDGEQSPAVFGPPSYTFSGYHRPEGILIAAGPHFPARGERSRLSILDVTPTLYWLFGVDQPVDLDGSVPPDLVGGDALAKRPVVVSEREVTIPPWEADRDADAIREQLETLGYVQ